MIPSDCWDGCEIDSQFCEAFFCGSCVALSGLGVSVLMVLDFITGMFDQQVGDEAVKPPRADDRRDRRAAFGSAVQQRFAYASTSLQKALFSRGFHFDLALLSISSK